MILDQDQGRQQRHLLHQKSVREFGWETLLPLVSSAARSIEHSITVDYDAGAACEKVLLRPCACDYSGVMNLDHDGERRATRGQSLSDQRHPIPSTMATFCLRPCTSQDPSCCPRRSPKQLYD